MANRSRSRAWPVAAALLLVGYLLYREALTWNKIVGVVICLIGLGFINYK